MLLVLTALFVTTACALVATGGFSATVAGVRFSAHSPLPAITGAFVAFALWFIQAARARTFRTDLESAARWIDAHAGRLIAIIAALAAAVAIHFETYSASGSDASGYLSEAVMLSSGALSRIEPLGAIADWPHGAATLAPLGWVARSQVEQVPTYAVGLPLLMALPHALGGVIGASIIVSLSAGLAVWFAGRLAMSFAGGAAGVLAAVWLATLPIEIYESIQPMSDVPTTAAWLACWWWCARTAEKGTVPFFESAIPLIAGIATGVAVLIRPNLAPLAVMPALYLMTRRFSSTRTRVAWMVAFAAPVAIAAASVAVLQWRWFGSPLRSGYGTASEIYAMSNVGPNSGLYFKWLIDTHGPWLLAAPLVLVVAHRGVLRWMLAFAAAICLEYFFYAVFDGWPYLRFLLPALAISAIAVSVLLASVTWKLPHAGRGPVIIAIVLAVGTWQVVKARELAVFRLASRQARAALAGRYLEPVVRNDAVVLSGEQSGAIRYYTGRSILRWDFLDEGAFRAAEERLISGHPDLWIVLDDWEAALFRDRFRGNAIGSLDWPPIVDAGDEGRTLAWRVRDRERFMRGEHVVTDRVR
ncbi:MAG TPA: hypothetical protein VEK56_04255 [Vicinamibacterales bacterium]|nr:hypothetical protein [Vicinamibacterales bacterium]